MDPVEPGEVCALDGVLIARNKAGKLVHLDALPRDVDPDHEPVPLSVVVYEAKLAQRSDLTEALMAMLRHHDTLCPGCEFRKVARRALGMPTD